MKIDFFHGIFIAKYYSIEEIPLKKRSKNLHEKRSSAAGGT
jgi:hypothetical protein